MNTQFIPSLGLTLAQRLTDNPEVMVLVIESGRDGHGDPRLTDSPKSVYFFNMIVYFFCKLDCFPSINSHHVAAGSFYLTWGLVMANQTVGGVAQNLTV